MVQIPLKVWQTWSSKILPEKMKNNVLNLRIQNPEFTYHLFDDEDCKEFIKNNYSEDVLNAFNNLKPGAYKADLWRYCILFKEGGIYLDIKFKCTNNFKLISLVNNEHFVLDRPGHWLDSNFGIYNALIIVKPENLFIQECINEIVKNVQNFNFGHNPLYVSGPGLMGLLYLKFYENTENIDMKSQLTPNTISDFEITYRNTTILNFYPEYREDQKNMQNYVSYDKMWKQNNVFEKINITENYTNTDTTNQNVPLNLFQIWHSDQLTDAMKNNINILKKDNPEFKYHFYDFNSGAIFLDRCFYPDVLWAFNNLIPRAYKSDFLRYCLLYVYGGIYIDIKFKTINDFKLITLTLSEHFCSDLKNYKTIPNDNEYDAIYNGIIIVKPKNKLIYYAIFEIINNVKTNFYGCDWLRPTGPSLLAHINNKYMLNSNVDIHFNEKKHFQFLYKNIPILDMYPTYYSELEIDKSHKHYSVSWSNNNIYLCHEPKTIPKKIWQTWVTKTLPPMMELTVQNLKTQNPEFEHYLFDDSDCENYIFNNFDIEVYNTYKYLIPGAFKADLWRYCILYKEGGIYLDIKFKSVGKFKLINLLNDEHFVLDRSSERLWLPDNPGIYNALLVCRPENRLMLNCIKHIVYQTKNNFYSYNTLYISGPGLIGFLFSTCYTRECRKKIDLINVDSKFIFYKNMAILKHYDEYRTDQEKLPFYKTYGELWAKKKVYFLPIELEFPNLIEIFNKYKFPNSKILKFDPFDYLPNCIDNFISFFNTSTVHGFTENLNTEFLFSDFQLLIKNNFTYDLIIENSIQNSESKFLLFMQLFNDKLNNNGCFIINNCENYDLFEKFYPIVEQSFKSQKLENCRISLAFSKKIKNIIFYSKIIVLFKN